MSIYSVTTMGFSITGGLSIDISNTVTLGYSIGELIITEPLTRLYINGTIRRQLLLGGTVRLELKLNG